MRTNIRVRKNNRVWIYLSVAIAIVICLIAIKPVLANEILENTITSMRESEGWWDTLWRDTFDPSTISGNISIYSFTQPVRFVIGLGLLFWIADYGKKMVNSQGMAQNVQIFTESFLPIVLILLFLANQGLYSRVLAYGLRDLVNSWSEGVMEQQIAGKKIREALSEQFLVEEVKNEISQQAQKCMQMPRPEVILPQAERPAEDPDNPLTLEQDQVYNYLECLDKLKIYIEKKNQEAERTEACKLGCKFFKFWMKGQLKRYDYALGGEKAKRIIGYEQEEVDEAIEEEYHSMTDFLKNSERKGWMGIMMLTQWMWISFLEGSMWLLGLFAPIFIALSLIPGKQKMFSVWLIEFLTIGLAKLAYVILISIVAVQISSTASPLLSQDDRFFMALGAFAPGVSLAVVTSGGIAAVLSFRSQSVGAASVASSVITGSVVSAAYSFSRYADKRR